MRIFLSPVRRGYYRGNPVSAFQVEMSYAVCLPADGEVDPSTAEGSLVLNVADDLSDLYAKAWSSLLDLCSANSWGTPVKQDVFLYTNTTLDKVLP
jgi:hypothetical protein